jgi:hypothetical protein
LALRWGDCRCRQAHSPGRSGRDSGTGTKTEVVILLGYFETYFAATMAHALRNIFAVIVGFSDLLYQSPHLDSGARHGFSPRWRGGAWTLHWSRSTSPSLRPTTGFHRTVKMGAPSHFRHIRQCIRLVRWPDRLSRSLRSTICYYVAMVFMLLSFDYMVCSG